MSLQDLNVDTLSQAVARQYGQVAVCPDDDFPFPVGRTFAESLGYTSDLLDTLPPSAVESFTGISNPLAACRRDCFLEEGIIG